MLGMKKKPTENEKLIEANYKTLLDGRDRTIAELRVQITAQALQLEFWRENGRSMENQVRMWMGLYSEAMKTMSRLGEAPPDFERQRSLVKAALEAPRPGVEALIMAVAMATSNDLDELMARLPGMAPTFLSPKKLPRLPKKPPLQHVRGVKAENSALRG